MIVISGICHSVNEACHLDGILRSVEWWFLYGQAVDLGQIGCPGVLGRNNQSVPRKIPKKCISHNRPLKQMTFKSPFYFPKMSCCNWSSKIMFVSKAFFILFYRFRWSKLNDVYNKYDSNIKYKLIFEFVLWFTLLKKLNMFCFLQ
jgi:hypothetical protein